MAYSSIDNILDKSNILDLDITIDGKDYKIDMRKQLEISAEGITEAITNGPTYYAFLSALLQRALVEKRSRERKKNTVYGKLFNEYKSNYDTSQYPRGISNELVSAKIDRNIKYIKAVKEHEQITAQVDLLTMYVRAYEQRTSLIQTLSANLRREQ